MDLKKFKKSFPDAEERKGDLGSYLEIRVKADVYLMIFESDLQKPVLDIKGRHAPLLGIKNPKDAQSLINLFNG